ncbi:hypothetical protein B0T25DRAFT_544069 [Lasiosphaeria hispida]|uniref:Uncharacterized protein n=1 Tax=Lasiosphaeria hispida TaxID=260671 RepID=A0AAJ0HID0_9PEZI|nr:hypothetical protein B0T25DRAFT_544069 [Lasiosphaeria hispida]
MYGGEARKRERFDMDCSVTEPTARSLLADGLPVYVEDISAANPGSGFLQFWTVAAVFELRLADAGDGGAHRPGQPSELSRPQSCSDGEWSDTEDGDELDDVEYFDRDGEFNFCVKLIIGGRSGRAIGRIYVPGWWHGLAEIQPSNRPCRKEFILLCEARDVELPKNFSNLDRGWRYRVMLLEPKCEGIYYERIAVGWIDLDSLGEAVGGLSWKEIILG